MKHAMGTLNRLFGQHGKEKEVGKATERGRSWAIGKFAGVAGVLTTFLLLPLGQVPIAGTCALPSFSGPTNFAVGSKPFSVAVGDFNGDGKLDLAVANNDSSSVSILLGDGTGGFAPATPSTHAVGLGPHTVVVADFNGDGKLDLAVTNSGSKDVSILLGKGTGDFGPATSVGAAPSQLDARGMAVGDFNGDGKADLAVVNHFFGSVAILLGDGMGGFPTRTDFGAGSFPLFVAVADFNGDGKQDLVVGNISSNTVSILLGTGTGSFGTATTFAAGGNSYGVAVGDFNGDGKQDLALSSGGGSTTVSVLLGNGTGGFGVPTTFAVGASTINVTVGDFNGDGKLDLAVASGPSVSILLGDGTGSFGAATNFPVGTGAQFLAVGDFNGDGQLDLAVSNSGSNNVSILLNTCSVQVTIDIKPGSFPNSINMGSQGTIPVAILSSATFDAPSRVNRTSLKFGRTGTESSLAFCNNSPEDVNGDGLLDLVCHFNIQQTGFQAGDTQGVLTGKTVNGIPIRGTDSVNIVP